MDDHKREAFFNKLYNQYHRAIFAYLLTHVNHRETAKDLLQETFLRIWHGINARSELEINEPRSWVYRIAKNLVIDYYRRRSTQNKMKESLRASTLAKATPTQSRSAEEIFEMKDRIHDIEQAIRELPKELHRVLILQLIGQMNSREIGDLLDIPAGTVRYRLSLARKQLRQKLTQAQGKETIHDQRTERGI